MTLVFWLFVRTVIGIMGLCVVNIIFDLAQVPHALILIFFDSNSITASYQDIRKLALLTSTILINDLLEEPTSSLANLITIFTITISGRKMIFLSLGVLLVFGFLVL